MSDEKPNSDLQKLRDEIEALSVKTESAFQKISKDVADDRVERAAKQVELMRNWLGVWTGIVTVLLATVGVLGFASWSNIEGQKAKFKEASDTIEKRQSDLQKQYNELLSDQEAFHSNISKSYAAP